MTKLMRLFFLALAAGAAGLLVGACQGKKVENEIVIISPHVETIRKEWATAFERRYSEKEKRNVTVKWIDQGGASDDLKYIESAFQSKPEGIGIDVFFGGGVDPYLDLSRAGLLQKVDIPADIVKEFPAELNGVPLYDAGHLWYGTSLSGFGILINKEVAAKLGLPKVAMWSDLANPALQGWVELGDPRHSSTAHMLFEIILQKYGWDKGWELLAAIAANSRAIPEHSSQVPQDVSAGQVACGLMIDMYAYTEIESKGKDKLAFVLPADGTVITPDSIGLLKGAPNAEAARMFVEFVLSPSGQRIWMLRKGETGGPLEVTLNKMSILPSLYGKTKGKTNIEENPFEAKSVLRYDSAKGSARLGIVDELAGAILIDPHAAMVEAWKKAGRAGIGSIFKVPVSEEKVMALAGGDWKDAVKRNKLISEWKQAAMSRLEK